MCARLMLGFLALTFAGCGGSNPNKVKLQGSGASFPAILYDQWFKDYKQQTPDVTVDYQSTGSGAGVKAIIDGTVDFGASDAAMSDEEIAKVAKGVVLLPMTAGKVVLIYNLDGVPSLQLPRDVYPKIFLGQITKWNDPLIAAANPGVALPDVPINVVVRADSSGTSYVFSKHLSAINKDFEKSPGTNKSPNWPIGVKAKGNEGIANSIKTTPGSIGYVEYGYAKTTGLTFAKLQNKSGAYVEANTASGQAALATAVLPENLIAWIPDPEGANAYPIVTFTWMICYKKYDDANKANALKALITWCLDKGQETSEKLGYLPLPPNVIEKVKKAAEQIGS